MKQLMIAPVLMCCSYFACAQTDATGGKWKETGTAAEQTEHAPGLDFSKTTISLKNRKIEFAGLPPITKPAVVSITNKDGEVVQQTKVNPLNNIVDIRYLDNGTYYVHLLYKSKDMKGFVLNL